MRGDVVLVHKAQVYELATRSLCPLVTTSPSNSGRPTILLFWTKWCLSSIRMLNYLVIYSKQYNLQADFVAVHYGHENTAELLELLRKAGYLDTTIRFVIDIKHTPKAGLLFFNL
jgi:thiol-disulfide isomerase/thioredoxin